jgi:hypothetical protein
MRYPAVYGDTPQPSLALLIMTVMIKMNVVESGTMKMELTRMRNMTPKSFNWECIITFNTSPREEENTFVNLLDYVNPNPKTISKEYQAERIQKGFPLDSIFQFPSFYQGENMWNILLSELVHEAAVQGGVRFVFLHRSEHKDNTSVQYTIDCVRCNVYGDNMKKGPNANNFKGGTLVQISSMLMVLKWQ